MDTNAEIDGGKIRVNGALVFLLNTEDTKVARSTRRFLFTETGADETYDLGVIGYGKSDRNEQSNDRGERHSTALMTGSSPTWSPRQKCLTLKLI